MTSTSRQLTRAALAIAAALCIETARPAFAETIMTPPMPSNIQAPAGHKVFLRVYASGTQNYVCLPSGGGYAWTFFGPQATLFLTFKWVQGDIFQQVGTHFLSPNPAENGVPRPTWQSSFDTSAVWGRAIASSTDPNFVAPGAIPWLLVQVVGTQRGPTGGESLTPTTFIQRLNTSGGVAPATGCSQAGNVGSTALVPYNTDYFFYSREASLREDR